VICRRWYGLICGSGEIRFLKKLSLDLVFTPSFHVAMALWLETEKVWWRSLAGSYSWGKLLHEAKFGFRRIGASICWRIVASVFDLCILGTLAYFRIPLFRLTEFATWRRWIFDREAGRWEFSFESAKKKRCFLSVFKNTNWQISIRKNTKHLARILAEREVAYVLVTGIKILAITFEEFRGPWLDLQVGLACVIWHNYLIFSIRSIRSIAMTRAT